MDGDAGALLVAVVADRFDRAAFHRLLAERGFGVVFGLFENVAVTAVVVAGEIGGRRFATEIAVDALIIDEVSARHVFGIFVSEFGHNSFVFLGFSGLENRKHRLHCNEFLCHTARAIPPLTRFAPVGMLTTV